MARPFRWGNGRMREEKNAKAELDTSQKAPSTQALGALSMRGWRRRGGSEAVVVVSWWGGGMVRIPIVDSRRLTPSSTRSIIAAV